MYLYISFASVDKPFTILDDHYVDWVTTAQQLLLTAYQRRPESSCSFVREEI